ncbi:MAG TPA: (2Fe-2S)-binding protein [Candidatus Limnocylindria bacterium]|nr:(2Fe-2S)-binding protein [Candidatus Limnocylindria bacterium]
MNGGTATGTTTLRVNGSEATSAADPETPLLYVLRNDLGLKGTKFGCGIGVCGACVVRVDGKPEPSCLLPLGAVGHREVTTIESLADGDRLDPLQVAFLELQAGQCGYCLSGILMAARALLDENPHPTRAEITEALDEHICRCGAMDRMVRAVERASQMEPMR